MPPSQAKTILVVEDDTQIANLLVELISRMGYEVFHAADGLYALKYLEENCPDLMIVDIMMPRLDGMAFNRAVKYLAEKYYSELGRIQVIMLTARSDARTMIDCINVGCRFFLPKPFNAHDLKSKIKKALGEEE